MNPCRCGYLGDGARECGRAPRCGEDYQHRISGPLLDRVDLTVEVQPASAAELAARADRRGDRRGRRAGGARAGRRNGRATARPDRPAMPRSTRRQSAWRRRRRRSPARRWTGCACRRAATRACCGWRARIADLAGAEPVGRVACRGGAGVPPSDAGAVGRPRHAIPCWIGRYGRHARPHPGPPESSSPGQPGETVQEVDGQRPVAMTGGTARHSRITINIHTALRARLRGTRCSHYGPDTMDLIWECKPLCKKSAVRTP